MRMTAYFPPGQDMSRVMQALWSLGHLHGNADIADDSVGVDTMMGMELPADDLMANALADEAMENVEMSTRNARVDFEVPSDKMEEYRSALMQCGALRVTTE